MTHHEHEPLGQGIHGRKTDRAENPTIGAADREAHRKLILRHADLEEVARRQHGLVRMDVTLGRPSLERRTLKENRLRV